MNSLEFIFDDDGVYSLLGDLESGATLSGAEFLTALDTAEDADVEAVMELLDFKQIDLDVSDLPRYPADSASALRLRREAQLAKQGNLLESLEENDPLRLYLEELTATAAVGDVSELAEELARCNREGQTETDVHTQMMNSCLRRVVELAYGYTDRGVLLMDLIQEGSMGLWLHLSDYEGGGFPEFRDKCIHRQMAKTVVLQAHSAGVGQKLRQAMEDYRSVDEKLLAELGRNPTVAEIAEALHITPEEGETVAKMLDSARQLHRAKTPEQEEIPQEEDQAVEDTAYFQMRQRIAELLSVLPEADAKLLSLRYGLEGGAPLDAVQTAARLGLTPEEVNQREAAALRQLRKH